MFTVLLSMKLRNLSNENWINFILYCPMLYCFEAAVDSPVGQERVEQFLLLFEQGTLPLVRRHGVPVGRRG